jgi:serine phosphatase RsbU (regulator of sigma subunit)
MNPTNAIQLPSIDWSVAARPLPGQTVSGDLHVLRPFDGGVLLAVVDGIGHGTEAIAAARVAAGILQHHAPDSIISLVQHCHQSLARTRGVVMTVASVSLAEGTLTWLGVGNVEACLLRANPGAMPASETVLLRGGLIGYQLPALHASVIPIAPGDLLVFATDGIRHAFTRGVDIHDPPKRITQRILTEHFKGTDDALVLAVRYLGPTHEQ